MATTVSISFILTGIGFEPNDITKELSIIPTKTWRINDDIGKPGKSANKHKYDGWKLSTGHIQTLDVESSLNNVLEILQPVTEKLKELILRLNLGAEISCAIHIENGETPSIHFQQTTLRKITELNAEIDIDLYVFEDEKEFNKE
jgi:hypothetical protein